MINKFRGGAGVFRGNLKLIISAVLTAVLLSGCAALWEREVYERFPHVVQEDVDIEATALKATSYDTLKTVIINVIRSGMTEADIRVTDYPGELTSKSLSTLLNDIQKSEPIGAYAVEYIAYELTRVLSQYTVSLSIIYRLDIPPVKQISGSKELRETVTAALLEYETSLTVEMPYFYAQEHDVVSMVRSYYYSNPAWAIEYPKVTVTLYPSSDSSLRRIIELELEYDTPGVALRQKSFRTNVAADVIVENIPTFDSDAEIEAVQTTLWLHDTLCEIVRYDEDTAILAVNKDERQDGDPYTAYGALVGNSAVSEGYAMSFRLLCDYLGLSCLVVTGQWNGYDHAWNLVRIGDAWYHLDVARDDMGPVPIYEHFLMNDQEAAGANFSWDHTQYPAAISGEWTYELIPTIAEETETIE